MIVTVQLLLSTGQARILTEGTNLASVTVYLMFLYSYFVLYVYVCVCVCVCACAYIIT